MIKKQSMVQDKANWNFKRLPMFHPFVLFILVLLSLSTASLAQDENNTKAKEPVKVNNSDAKELSGMSIVGNDEAPKSLYIVPWKSSEIGAETRMRALLNESDTPVDREVFRRQLEFYLISTADEKP